MKYVLIEQAGSEHQVEIRDFETLTKAINYRDHHYTKHDLQTLNVDIVKRLPDGTLTTEF